MTFSPGNAERQSPWLLWLWRKRAWILLPLAIFYCVEAADYFLHLRSGLFDAENRYLGRDFSNWWTGARLILDGKIATLFDVRLYHQAQADLFSYAVELRNWSYPPSVFLWILWLGLLPYTVALVVWTEMGFALYAFAAVWKRPQPWALALILALAPSTCINLVEGQTGFLTAAFLIGGLRLLDEAPVPAGILFGLLGFKPHFGLFVPVALLAGRYWRASAVALATVAVLAGINIYLFGMQPWLAYFDVTVPFQRRILETDVRGLTYQGMMISPFMAARILGGSVILAYGVTAVTALLSVAAVIYVFARSRSMELRTAVTVTATFFTSPYMFTYDTPALSAAVIAMIIFALAERRNLRPAHLLLFAVAWLLPLFAMDLNGAKIPVYPLVVAALLWMQVRWAVTPPSRFPLSASRMPA